MLAGIRPALCRTLAAGLLVTACTGDGEPVDGGPLTDVTGEVADGEMDGDGEAPEPGDDTHPAAKNETDADDADVADVANHENDADVAQGDEVDDASEDPYAIPDDPTDIDDDYVDGVMNAILAARSEILHEIISREAGELPSEQQMDRLRALTSGPTLLRVGQEYVGFSRDEDRRSSLRSPEEFGTMAWTTHRVMHADAGCILAVGFLDLRETAVEPFSDETLWVVVLNADAPGGLDPDASEVNPTPWRYHQDNIMSAGGEPISEDEWDELDYADRLELPCEEYEP